MNKVLKVFTYTMFIITLLITLLYLIALAIFIFDEPYIFPIVIFSLIDIFLVFYCIHYFNCIKYLKNKESLKEKTIKSMKKQSKALIILQGIFAFSALLVLIGTTLYYQTFFKEQLFFFIPFIITLSYTLNHVFLDKNIK